MAKLTMVTMFITLVGVMSWIQGSVVGGLNQEVNWAKRLESETKEAGVTNLQFYFHDTLSGKTPTAVRIAQASNTQTSPTLFGALMMVDDALTEGPEPTSKLVGRAQGLYGSAGQAELGLIMALDYGFIDGIYMNGSSISILGRNRVMNPGFREMPVVGGTGVFRLARGYAIAKTHWFDITSGDAIVAYNVTVYH